MMTLATLSTSSIEEAMAVATGPVWLRKRLLSLFGLSPKLEKASASFSTLGNLRLSQN